MGVGDCGILLRSGLEAEVVGKKVKVAEREWIRDADHVDVETEYEMVIPKGDWSFGCICSLYICMTTYAYHAWLKHSCSCVQ